MVVSEISQVPKVPACPSLFTMNSSLEKVKNYNSPFLKDQDSYSYIILFPYTPIQ